MAEMQPDLREGHRLQVEGERAVGVHDCELARCRWGKDLAVRERKIRDCKTRIVVAHRGADDELEINREDASEAARDELSAVRVVVGRGQIRSALPPA